MIRPLVESDFNAAIQIVNRNWKNVYVGYVNQGLLNDAGCQERSQQLREDFINHRLSEYVWEESGQILGLLSMGTTADTDKASAFEIWRIYIAAEAQGKGIGGRLLVFAELEFRRVLFRSERSIFNLWNKAIKEHIINVT